VKLIFAKAGRRIAGLVEAKTGRRLVPVNFYSPLPDRAELATRPEAFWSPPPASIGIDFRLDAQKHLLGQCAPFLRGYDYPTQGSADEQLTRYYDGNSQFGYLDSRMLFAMLQLWRPARIVEVGSGYSTLLMADVNQRFLGGTLSITAIEPFPRPFLRKLAGQGVRLLEQKVQALDTTEFQTLQRGDILFIDSSHVSKTGSDVNRLVFDILPCLNPGVRIHFHDVFLPYEYPRDWIAEGRSWNEQYIVRTMLQYGQQHFRVLFGSAYAASYAADAVTSFLAGHHFGGGSFWIEKI
jgi:predicted O-methyltransferase YrrM